MRTRKLILPLSMLAAAGGLAAWTLIDSPAAQDGAGDGPTTSGEAPSPSRFPRISSAGWGLGTTYSHDVSLRMDLLQTGSEVQKTEINGIWKTTVVRVTAKDRDLQVSFEPAPATTAGYSSLEQLPALRQTFTARYDLSGKASALIFPRAASDEATRFLRELVTTFQLTVPAASEPAWTASELDPGGEVSVSYQRVDADRILRRKGQYLRVPKPEGLLPPTAYDLVPRILRSEGNYQLDGDGRIKNASVVYASRAKSKMSPVEFSIEMQTSFRFLSRGTAAVAQAITAEPAPRSLTLDDKDFEVAEINALKDAVKGKTARQLLDDMHKAVAEKSAEASATARFQLRSLMRLDDRAVDAAAAEIRSRKHEKAIFSTLGGAGTPAAQALLVESLKDRDLAAEHRLAAIHSTNQIKVPTPETLVAVEEAAAGDRDPQVKHDAAFARGTLVRQLAKLNPNGARTKVQELAAEYDPASSIQDKRRILGALGNTHSPDAIPTIKEGLLDREVGVRDAAARALRFIPGAEVDQIVVAVLTGTDVQPVRLAALWSAEGRPYPAMAAAYQTLVRGEKDDRLRATTVQLLYRLMLNDLANKDVPQLLQWVAQNDADDEIKQIARQSLDEAKEALALSTGDQAG